MSPPIRVYTALTCGGCWSLKRWLTKERISYREVPIDNDAGARQFVREAAGGYMSVPTVVLPNGRVLIEPTPAQLRAALDVCPDSWTSAQTLDETLDRRSDRHLIA